MKIDKLSERDVIDLDTSFFKWICSWRVEHKNLELVSLFEMDWNG